MPVSRSQLLAAALLASALAGCHQQTPTAQRYGGLTKEDFDAGFRTPAPHNVGHPQTVAVAQGLAPLAYRVETPGSVRVSDMTDRADLAYAQVERNTFVYVDEHAGVTVGHEKLYPGPLIHGHSYAIYIEVDESPAAKPPASQPAPRQS